MFQRNLQSVLVTLLTSVVAAQTVPPAPVISSPVIAVGQTTLNADLLQCLDGGTACGLSNCRCWWQIWKAQCSKSASSCPAFVAGTPYVQSPNSSISSSSPDGNGGTNVVFQDTDPVLAAGTIWSYYLTVNFAEYVPQTLSPPSNQIIISIPAVAGSTLFSVYLDYDNASCTNKSGTACHGYSTCTCSTNAYRAACSTATSCPAYSKGSAAYTLLPVTSSTGSSYVTSTVGSTNTHFHFQDDGNRASNLNYGKIYGYVTTNIYTADTTNTEGTASSVLVVTTPLHIGVINWSNPGCNTTTTTCIFQVYRATCTSPTTCPTYPSGTWKKLPMTPTLTTTTGTQGTTWRYSDTDSALTGSTTYSWVAVVNFQGNTSVSSPSAAFIATTNP